MILHLDIDSFFVSAERTKDKSLIGKEVAVGGRSDRFIFSGNGKNKKAMIANKGAFVPSLFLYEKGDMSRYFVDEDRIRGIIITSSYEARECGVKTGMSIREALSLCPSLTVLPPNHILYHTLSFKLGYFLKKLIPKVEQYSIDEFFADCSGWIDDEEVESFAWGLKNKIKRKFDLPISIGISNTKWIAKLATSYAKPNGVKLIRKEDIFDFIHDIPIEKFPGIGKSWKKRLHNYKKMTLLDVWHSKTWLYSQGRAGKELYDRVCGLDNDKVEEKKERKSIGISRTFDPILDRDEIKRRIYILSRHLSFIAFKTSQRPSTIFLHIKYEFNERAKKYKSYNRLFNERFLKIEFVKLFDEIDRYKNSKIIRLSLALSNFHSMSNSIFSLLDYEEDKRQKELYGNIDRLRAKYGLDILKHAKEL
ncbi:MAG: DNA polymerase IV [Epsilonproteobacteria bacterium]|nr:DNA polymerase IV [Campylobacterota bacterium]